MALTGNPELDLMIAQGDEDEAYAVLSMWEAGSHVTHSERKHHEDVSTYSAQLGAWDQVGSISTDVR